MCICVSIMLFIRCNLRRILLHLMEIHNSITLRHLISTVCLMLLNDRISGTSFFKAEKNNIEIIYIILQINKYETINSEVSKTLLHLLFIHYLLLLRQSFY